MNIGEGKVKLLAGGAPVGTRDELLWAFINNDIADAKNGEWIIEPVPQMGEDCFM